MKRRIVRFSGTGLSSLLLVGCLFQQSSVRQSSDETNFVRLDTAAPLISATSSFDAVPRPPSPPSDYHPREKPMLSTAAETVLEVQPVAMTRTASAPREPAVEPAAPEEPLVAALRFALEKHPEEAAKLLSKYDKSDRELLLGLLRLTANLGEGDMEKLSPKEISQTLEQLRQVTNGLKQKAPLSLDNVCFCKKIHGFGRYVPSGEGYEFLAGSDDQPGERVQVYAEVRNFVSRQVDEHYETVMESRLEIHDAERNVIAKVDLGKCVDRSQSPRQDYFLNFQMHVPPKLSPGLYTLWLKVKDVNSNPPRETQCSLDFKVRACGGELP